MIELTEMIGQLRSELAAAMAKAADEDLRFDLGPVTLETEVLVERSASAGGKLQFWVAELGGDGRIAKSSTQRITLVLQPKLRSGEQTWVSGDATNRER